MSDPGPLVVVALSARALVAATVRAGRSALAIDLFDDADTGALALASRRVGGSFVDGPDLDETLAAIDALASATRTVPAGLVVGAGFEHRPAALERLSERLPLLGTPAGAIARAKDPLGFAGLLARLGVPHPEVRAEAPEDAAGWLAKEAAAAGGHHVRPAAAIEAASGRYFQRHVAGRALSAAFLADGRRSRLLAFCEIRTAPTPGSPYRFSGVVGPVPLDRSIAAGVAAAIAAIVASTGLSGLCGADIVVDGEAWWLLEINPRPTAAIDVLDRGSAPLMALHLAAVTGELPLTWRPPVEPAGTAVVFSPRRIETTATDWPAWMSDRPRPCTSIGPGEPVVTVHATGPTPESVITELKSLEEDALTHLIG